MGKPTEETSTAGTLAGGVVAPVPRSAKWLVGMIALQSLGSGLTQPFVMIYLHEVRGMDLALTGMLLTVSGVVGLVVSLPSGQWIDRYGGWNVLVVGTCSMCVSALVLVVAVNPLLAAAALALSGFNLGVSLPSKNVLIAQATSGSVRKQLFAANFVLLDLSWGIGGLVGGFVLDVERPSTFVVIFLTDAVMMFTALTLLLGPLRTLRSARPTVSRPHEFGPVSIGSVLRDPSLVRLMLITVLVTFIGYGQLQSGIPVFAREVSGVSLRTIGIAFAINTAMIVLLQFVVSRALDGKRRTRAMIGFGAVWALAWSFFATTSMSPGSAFAISGFLIFIGLFALGEMILMPLLPVMTNDLATDRNRGRYNALQSAAFHAGGLLGPAFAGVTLQGGSSMVYVGAMVLTSILIVFVACSWERTIDPAMNGG